MSPENAAPDIYFADLFERARQRLSEQLGPAAGTALAEPAVVPFLSTEGAPSARVIAQLRLDDRTREVVIRFCDAQTGATIREVPPTLLAVAARRVPPAA